MSSNHPDDDDFRVDDPPELPWEAGGSAPMMVDNWDIASDSTPCTVYRDGPGTMGRVTTPLGDLNFANLFGAPVTMARQLGRRSASEIREGALPFLSEFLPDVVEALVPATAVMPGNWILENWLLGRLRQALPDEYLKMARAFGEGSGMDVERVLAAQLLFDVWGLLARAPLGPVQKATARARRHSPLLGSLSMVLPTNEDGPLHLRWLDNTAVERWDRKSQVSFFQPDRGIAYVMVSSVGFLTGLPTGMNAAGLTLSVEPGIVGEVDLSGVPLGPAAHQVLSHAHSIEEAAAILRQYPSMVPWRYVLTEGDTGRAAIFQVSIDGARLESMKKDAFAVMSADEGVARSELERVERWHRYRRQSVNRLIEGWDGGGHDAIFTALEAMAAPTVETRSISGHPLCGLSNVGAVVFEPAARRLWIAAGRAPAGRRWFVPLSLRGGDGRGGGVDTRVRPIKPGGEWETSSAGRAMENLRHAYQLDLSGEAPQRVLITLEYALALESKRPAFHILTGLMALKAGRGKRAEGAFQRAISLLEDAAHRTEVGVYLAFSLDLQRRRKAAKKLYSELAADPTVEAAVRRWAQRFRRRRFRESDARELKIDFNLATAFF